MGRYEPSNSHREMNNKRFCLIRMRLECESESEVRERERERDL